MLVDANILLYGVDSSSPVHDAAREWLEEAVNGPRRVGIPWMSFTAFVRIATNPRALRDPLPPAEAWQLVEEWLDAPAVWVPEPGRGHREILGRLIGNLDLRANLVTDAVLAALCIEHGLQMISADSDFARFSEITWHNPVRP
ncbi:MAG TPA: TA system VapC family ribonuclease toxin [Acidimicrobiales bacterium]|nr:TA system VapC family ribonuclease toxin [Acidimicrobiales bacterium]